MLLNIKNLNTKYYYNNTELNAVENFNLSLEQGKITGIVGESGSGKTAAMLSVMKLINPAQGRISADEILFEDKDISKLNENGMRKIRGKDISFIFQEPVAYLNPSIKVGTQIIEPLLIHSAISKNEALKKAKEIMIKIGIKNVEQKINCYPFQLSGGQLQRILIATALIADPKLIIADEPTTALDVYTQVQILKIFQNLKIENNIAIIIISHDLPLISTIADNIAVMYSGKIVEYGNTYDIINNPLHPYTKKLISSLETHSKWQELSFIDGNMPDISNKPIGCYFNTRCNYAKKICFAQYPEYIKYNNNHYASCYNI